MTETPETIYLIPGEDSDGAPCMVWCDDPAPSYACDPAEAVKYVRADKHRDLLAMRQRQVIQLADALGERYIDAKAQLKRIEELETMVKVFRGCIETGLMPEPGSPCQRKVFELVGESEGGGKA